MKPLKGSTIEHAFYNNWTHSNIAFLYPLELYNLQMRLWDPITHRIIETVDFSRGDWRLIELI